MSKGAAKRAAKRAAERDRLSRALRRQWRAGILLQRRSWSITALARTLGVSKATCQRDVDLLADLFAVQVASDPFHRQRSYYRMVGAFKSRTRKP